ncbi:class I SAM-dependent methyltransferase [Alphaproteobacteria bacterium]|nr:class I SAM-dependent methyltransferase [Alphaproteobacteria bacterium]
MKKIPSATERYEVLKIAKSAFLNQKNVVKTLNEKKAEFLWLEDSDIIEIAYDLQAGTYSSFAHENPTWFNEFASQVSTIFSKYGKNFSAILDAGCGELTTTTYIFNHLHTQPKKIYALDLSFARLSKGVDFWSENSSKNISLVPVCAEMSDMPLNCNQVDATLTVHALEPNKSALTRVLSELLRVTKERIFLFEPCFERSDKESQKRMLEHGYIQNLEREILKQGAIIRDVIQVKNPANKHNPTFCFVVDPPKITTKQKITKNDFCFPGGKAPLERVSTHLYSEETGLLFPIINGIPILKIAPAILASKF